MSTDWTDPEWAEYHVSPRYLAGSSYVGEAGFAPVQRLGWPHQLDDLGSYIVSSPDSRIQIGFFGDDYDLWRIAAYERPLAAPAWTAVFNQNFPPEIVAGLTNALAQDWAFDSDRFLTAPRSGYLEVHDTLKAAGWQRDGGAELGTLELLSPDKEAGLLRDPRSSNRDPLWTLWAGPPGWGTRAEATFTSGTPVHLVAATAAAMADPAPVVRERHMIHAEVVHRVRLTPVAPLQPSVPRAPTPRDARQAAVAAAFQRSTVARARSTVRSSKPASTAWAAVASPPARAAAGAARPRR
jgi:hypothetical protein